MKSTLYQFKEAEEVLCFPCLYINLNGFGIVLFMSHNSGVVLKTNNPMWNVGYNYQNLETCENKTVWKKLPKGSQLVLENE